jgi:hydroxymethylbilane synthase
MKHTTPIKIGTRGSQLALAQAMETRDRLMSAHGLSIDQFEIITLSTSGDRIQDQPLSQVGGKGLFTKEIEQALLNGEIDLAVHSSKDMPTLAPEGLTISAYLPRETVHDAFISHHYAALSDVPYEATIGSSSLRRQAQLKKIRPDLNIVMFRGNVQTRLQKVQNGVVHGTLLALAGLKRLSLEHHVREILPLDDFLPAPGQGAICIETRTDDRAIHELVEAINHVPTQTALMCERAFLSELDGDCRTPIAAYAQIEGETVRFKGTILTPDGSIAHSIEKEGLLLDAARIGAQSGVELKYQAGAKFFSSWA